MAMRIEKFDAYGGLLPEDEREERDASTTAFGVLSRIGQYVFWLLVAVVISARIIYWPAGPASEFPRASESRSSAIR